MIMRIGVAISLTVLLGACGHKPLKAPCEPGEAQPLTSFVMSMMPEALGVLAPHIAGCGPMLPL